MYCQKCRTPLKLDGSLESLNPAAFELLVSKFSTRKATSILTQAPRLNGQDRLRTRSYLILHPSVISFRTTRPLQSGSEKCLLACLQEVYTWAPVGEPVKSTGDATS